jgi:hypothetical protein
MPEPPMRSGPILDYSSPRPRGQLRLPSQSRIEMLPDPDGVIVHEWLAARGQAIFAIVFATGTMAMMPLVFISSEWRQFQRPVPADVFVFAAIVVAVLIAGLVVMALVISNTWRHTWLETRRDSVILRFHAPFGGERFEWNASEVEDVRLENTTRPADRNHLAEFELHIAAQPVIRLFTDHTIQDLLPIETAVRNVLFPPTARRRV